MEQEIRYLADKPFDNNLVTELDMESIHSGIEHGNMYLTYQFESIRDVRSNCRMLLSWIIGAMMALTGCLIATAAADVPNIPILISTGYELVFAFVIAVIIFHGAMFKRAVHLPGDTPSHFFQNEILSPLKGRNDKAKYIIGWHLYEIQARIMYNKKEQMHEVKVYRRALALCLVALLSGAVLLTVLLLLEF